MKEKILNDLDISNLKLKYNTAEPFKHVIVDNFFNLDLANILSEQFPDFNKDEIWNIYNNPLENKKLTTNWNLFPPETYQVFTFLYSTEFINIIEEIIDVPNIIPDFGLHGGGWHVTPSGGKLNIHLDYSIHPKLKLERRANLIIYLTKDWKSDYGGKLELWSHDNEKNLPKECKATIDCTFNRAVLFDTTQNSWHGVPEKLKSPKNVYRKSLNIYYLTEPRKDISNRDRALFAPYLNQQNDQEILELIKSRSVSKYFEG